MRIQFLERPSLSKRAKREEPKIGNGSEGKKEGAGDHEVFFRDF